jgi:hypothetical protein
MPVMCQILLHPQETTSRSAFQDVGAAFPIAEAPDK